MSMIRRHWRSAMFLAAFLGMPALVALTTTQERLDRMERRTAAACSRAGTCG